MYFLNKIIVFIIIVFISSIVSIALISICEFKMLTGLYKRDNKRYDIVCETEDNFMDKQNAKKITIKKDRQLKFKNATCLFIEDDNVKKDVFIETDKDFILMEYDKPRRLNKNCKVKAFYYDKPYDIYYTECIK